MKLARVGPDGQEIPVLVGAQGCLRDLSGHIPTISGAQLSTASLAQFREIPVDDLPLIDGTPRYGIPVDGIRKIVAIGLNYTDHADESGLPIPIEPIIFLKSITSLCGPNEDIPMPPGSERMDWEVELGIVIGTKARYVAREEALNCVAGYLIVNDVSERSHQLERGGTWDKGKGHDNFAPVGPWLVTRDELGDASGLDMFLNVSGHRCQTGNTDRMIFSVAEIVSYVSQFMTLEPGDLIATGTPPGVGMGMVPPRYLKVGDEMHLGITGLGEQRQRVVALRAHA